MRAELLIDQQCVNPVYLSSVDRTGIEQLLTMPAGTVLEDPDCWRLCTIDVARPIDDECRERVLRFIGNPARQELLRKIRSLIAAEGVQRLDAKTLKWLELMKASYGRELGLTAEGSAVEDVEN